MSALFACTRCMSRHPFEELSPGQQLCKECRGAFPVVKCTYCRSEFQESSKGGTTVSVCRKCEQNLKLYGKPTSCEYCNIIAAFIGSKCQRCTNSEKKYGSPVTCDQCKQRCAFDRKDDSRKRVDGKLMCWLCTLSYKRALAKAKQNLSSRHPSLTPSKISNHHRSSSQNHKHSSSHSSKLAKYVPLTTFTSQSSNSELASSPNKKPRLDLNKSANGTLPSSDSALIDTNSSDHVVALTQLKDQIAVLQKQLTVKDQQMFAKEKQIGEMKAQHGILERELRLKIQEMQKKYDDTVQDLQSKVRVLQKQVVTLQNLNKKKSTDSPQRL